MSNGEYLIRVCITVAQEARKFQLSPLLAFGLAMQVYEMHARADKIPESLWGVARGTIAKSVGLESAPP